MKRNDLRKKRVLAAVLAVGLCTLLSGCAMFESAIPSLTKDEQELVVEYAAETLLRYDTRNGGRVKQVKEELFQKPEIVGEPEEPAEPSEPEETPVPESMTIIDNPDVVEEADIIDNTGEGESVYSTIEDALGMADTIAVTYDGYQIADYYPEDIGNYFVMNAQDGYKLLVLRFLLTNRTGSDLDVQMPYGSVRYKVSLNGNTKNALSTLLLNDLAAYSGTLAPGESEELVLVTEYTPGELSDISSLSLIVKGSGANATITLQ